MDNRNIKILAQSSPDHTITMQDLDDNFGHLYYCNARMHLSMMMSRMVKNGHFIRVKKGTYKLNSMPIKNKNKAVQTDPNQSTLF
jgi:predicted transcriptional regulator of viral defense system